MKNKVKLQAKTKEQLEHIASFFNVNLEDWNIGKYPIYALQMREPITFNQMAKIVDYLREQNNNNDQRFKESDLSAYNL